MKDTQTNGNALQHARSPVGSDSTLEDIRSAQRTLAEHAKQVALASGDIEPRPEVVEELKRLAEATGHSFFLPAFDDSQYQSDQIRSEECKKAVKDRDQLEQAERFAVADVRDRENELAQLQSGIAEPESPQLLMFAAGFVLALTVAPTLHDFLFISLNDELINWFASMVSSSFVAALIVVGIMGNIASTRRISSHKGLIAGVVISLGLTVLRLSQATGVSEVAFTAALTIVEIGLIVLLEWRATALRVAFSESAARNAEVSIARARLEVARSGLARLRESLIAVEGSISRHIRYVEDRLFRNSTVDNIVNEAVHSAISGYAAGTSANRGRALGTKNTD